MSRTVFHAGAVGGAVDRGLGAKSSSLVLQLHCPWLVEGGAGGAGLQGANWWAGLKAVYAPYCQESPACA